MRRLVVVYNVDELSLAEISNLEVAAIVQAEAESGDRQHPAVRVRSTLVADPIEVEAIDREMERGGRREPAIGERMAAGGVPIREYLDDVDRNADLRTLREFLELSDAAFPSTRVDSALAALARIEATS